MNRNNERHFLNIPQINISRSTFNRPQTILTTFDAGQLVPFYVDEVLPGDTFRVSTAAIIRQTTPKYPVMDDAFIDLYYFFVPNRIVWDDFKHFMGEADETPWMPTQSYSVPEIRIGEAGATATEAEKGPKTGSILDYMGVPTNVVTNTTKNEVKINALPIRGYVKIWNEFFRDQNIDNAAVIETGNDEVKYEDDGDTQNTEQTLQYAINGARCLPVNKFHDYFTSSLPYPQRGPEITLPMTGNASVYWGNATTGKPYTGQDLDDLGWTKGTGYEYYHIVNTQMNSSRSTSLNEPAKAILGTRTSTTTQAVGMVADLSSVQAATINDLRNAFAVQQYYEALARGGSRYREQVRALFATIISDKTVQVPEYLGGGRYHVNMNQIVQTSAANDQTNTPLGETGAISVTPINEASFTKSFEEHGFVLGVMCVRHNRTYQQGLERFWSRKDRLDYYFPQFANLGEQPVKKKEIYLSGTETDDETFGYQEAWADYRMKPNRVSGKMRSNAEGTLDFWHYADNYDKAPTLSQDWLKEGKAEIARTLIVQDEPQFFGAIRVSNKTTRPMPLYSVPGLTKM